MSDALVQLESVSKRYGAAGEAQQTVLHDVSLRIEPGEFACIIGPSGSGKSTLLNLIGLLDRASAGRIYVAGEDISQLDDDGLTRMRSETLGFVFQFHHLIGALTAAENVMLPLAIRTGHTSEALLRSAQHALERVGLGDYGKALPRQLSGGQQQRVAIARAIVTEPRLLLADEPTGNLDTQTSSEVFARMRELNAELGMAFIVVTHDPRIAAQSDRIIEVVDGRVSR